MSLGHANFLSIWRQNVCRRVLLMKVEISAPSAKTLYFSDSEDIPGGFFWQAAISGGVTVNESSNFLSPGPDLATCEVTLVGSRYVATLGATIEDSLASYQWQGATVTLYRWERSLSSSFSSHSFIQFKGRVNRPVPQNGMVTLYCMQGRTWNQKVPTKALDKIGYPNSPDVGTGKVIPVVYGQFIGLNMRSPWTDPYNYRRSIEDLGQGCGAVPGVLTDPGYGANNVRITYAEHAVKTLLDRSTGFTQFIVGGNQLDPLDTTGLTTSLSGDSYLEIDDDSLVAYHGVVPTDVFSAASTATPNTATSPRNAMDIFDETTFATINQNVSASRLLLVLPQPAVLGLATDIKFYVGWSGNAGNGNNLQVFAYDPVTATAYTLHSFVATTTTPNFLTYSDFSTLYANWQIAGDGSSPAAGGTVGVAMTFTGGTTNQAKVYALGVVFKYRPQRTLVVPSTTSRTATASYDPQGRRVPVGEGIGSDWITVVRPGVFQLDGQFYGHIEGYADNGGGDYTGTASALIQCPPDIIRHLLVNYGDEHVTNSFETGATAFGSWVRARALLRGGAASGYNLACFINTPTSVQEVAKRIAQQSLSLYILDSSDSKWKYVTWDQDKPIDYTTYTLDRDAVEPYGKIEQDPLSDLGIRQNVRVPWYYDHFRGRSLFTSTVETATSTRGYNQATYRDQQPFVVSAANNKIDWTSGGVNYTDTLANATYADPMALAAQVRTQLRTRDADFHNGWGFSIRQTHAYVIAITVSGTDYDALMNDGDYGPETLAAEAQRALNALGHGLTFTVTYSHTTNKFTIAASGTFTLRAQGAHHMGFINAAGPGTSLTAEYARYAETFWFAAYSPDFNFRWASGASTANGAHQLLGFDVADTASGENISASYRRNNRETLAAASAATWGEAEVLTLPSDYIRQEETAVLYRDRNADLRRQPRMKIRFSTHRLPDIQRGMVFGTAADLDDLQPFSRYGSDGSWSGKKFMVTEVHRHSVTQWHDEIVAIEVSN